LTGSANQEVTQLLQAWRDGEPAALDELIPLVHQELRRLARRYMFKERAGHTLQTTALVNEAYMRLVDSRRVNWRNRAHFFAISAQLMRRILTDSARARGAKKRGAGQSKVSLDEALIGPEEQGYALAALDDALTALATVDFRKSQVVELRFFGGLSAEETAEVLQVSPETVLRDWKLAKAWLKREINHGKLGTTPAGASD
jgi:RNA polymerase sigma factor (TIGR02999 family)